MKKIIFAIVAVIVSGLLASQAIAGTCTRTVGGLTFKKYCPGPIAGWTYSPAGKEEIWVPWDEALDNVDKVESICIASIDKSDYILKDITNSKRSYRIYKNDSLVTKTHVSSHQFEEWVLKLPPELKNYLLSKEFTSFDAKNSSGPINYKFKSFLPVAKAGNDQSVRPGETVTLDGSASSIENPYYCPNPGGKPDPDKCPLVYQWSFVSRPPNSVATLSGAALVKPTFVADLAGRYVLKLVVSSGEVKSKADEVIIRAYKIKRPVR